MRSWRDPADRDEPRTAARLHRDNLHYDRGDYSGRKKRFEHFDDDEEDGKHSLLFGSLVPNI